jgi:hypothetical protein
MGTTFVTKNPLKKRVPLYATERVIEEPKGEGPKLSRRG